MRAAALLGVLLWQAAAANEPPVARPEYMQYERALTATSAGAGHGQTCAVLDAVAFQHAAPALADVRIFPVGDTGAREIPYAMTLSEAVTEETQAARLLNLGGAAGGKIVFDLEMPARAYTGVTLDLDPEVHDFIATATVTGMDALGGGAKATALGTYTLFDLASQRLSRDTTLPLEESTFRYLHVVMSVAAAPGGAAPSGGFVPGMVLGAEVPPGREAQVLYTTVAETATVTTVGRESKAEFTVPARVPVERVEVVPAAGFKGNFSRDVKVTATTEAGKNGTEEDERAPLPEIVTGTVTRVHATEAGREIRSEELGVAAILGANLERAAKVEVAIENGDDQPLPIAAVRLEMRERKVCFDAPAAGSALALFYGDARLGAPVYDYQRLFAVSAKALAVGLGPEAMNAGFRARPEEAKTFTERHPEVLWIALIAAICALGAVAIKSSRNVGR